VPNKRATVLWAHPKDQNLQGFGAEFDLETGELKELGFTDADILKAIARAQGKSL